MEKKSFYLYKSSIFSAIKNYFNTNYKKVELLEKPKNEKNDKVTATSNSAGTGSSASNPLNAGNPKTDSNNQNIENSENSGNNKNTGTNNAGNESRTATTKPVLPGKGIIFTVQITASKLKPDITKPEFKALPDVFCLTIDGLNKCYSGAYSNYEQVKENVNECRKYFPGAFIVAFEDGKLLPVDKAIKKLNQ